MTDTSTGPLWYGDNLPGPIPRTVWSPTEPREPGPGATLERIVNPEHPLAVVELIFKETKR